MLEQVLILWHYWLPLPFLLLWGLAFCAAGLVLAGWIHCWNRTWSRRHLGGLAILVLASSSLVSVVCSNHMAAGRLLEEDGAPIEASISRRSLKATEKILPRLVRNGSDGEDAEACIMREFSMELYNHSPHMFPLPRNARLPGVDEISPLARRGLEEAIGGGGGSVELNEEENAALCRDCVSYLRRIQIEYNGPALQNWADDATVLQFILIITMLTLAYSFFRAWTDILKIHPVFIPPVCRVFVLASLIYFATGMAGAVEVAATCVSVTDGDTIVINTGAEQCTVRLNGIDAPELSQEYGDKSKAELERLVKGKRVRVVRTGMDAYGRMVGNVYCDGVDVNLAMVRKGAAWHYKRYSSNAALASAEQEARAARAGLWASGSPTPPWQYTQATPAAAAGPFWISDSGRVHNSTCRYYRNCKGMESATPDGEDCKTCGGRVVKPKTRKKR